MMMRNVCKSTYAKQIWNVIQKSVDLVSSVNWERECYIVVRRRIVVQMLIEFMLLLDRYATSFVLERTTGSRFEGLYEAGRKGRSGENCRQIYLECNEV